MMSNGYDLRALISPGLAYGLVLARGGSKGLPGKNVRPLGGHSLVAWAVACGRGASSVSRVLCSTDCKEIASEAERAGAEVPFLRPAFAASDSATDLDVFKHCIEWLASNENVLPEFFVQLRPTTPFRQATWVDDAIGMMRADKSITCVRTLTESHHTPFKMWKVGDEGHMSPALELEEFPEAYNMPRQILPKIYWHTGQLDIIRTETIISGSMSGKNMKAIFTPGESAVDIDVLNDFIMAELMFDSAMPNDLINILAKSS